MVGHLLRRRGGQSADGTNEEPLGCGQAGGTEDSVEGWTSVVTADHLRDSGVILALVSSVRGEPATSRPKQHPALGSSLEQRDMSLGPSCLDDEISRLQMFERSSDLGVKPAPCLKSLSSSQYMDFS